MNNSIRLVIVSSIASALMLTGAACKGGERTQPENPKPPAQPSQAPTAPAPEQKQEGAQAPAEGAEVKPQAPKAEVTPEAKKEADDLFASLCSTCHGPNGAGDGPVAAGFPVKPANFDTEEFQKRVTDEEIAKAIVGGGAAVGRSPLMPANPNLEGKPEVVEALVQKIRGFGKK